MRFFIFRDRVQIICRVRKSVAYDFAAVIVADLGGTLSLIRTKSKAGYDKSGDKARFMVACLLNAAPSLCIRSLSCSCLSYIGLIDLGQKHPAVLVVRAIIFSIIHLALVASCHEEFL